MKNILRPRSLWCHALGKIHFTNTFNNKSRPVLLFNVAITAQSIEKYLIVFFFQETDKNH